jgi:integrase
MGTVRFELQSDKVNSKTGLAPIRLIYQIEGERKYYSTGLKGQPFFWDVKKQCCSYLNLSEKKEDRKVKGLLMQDAVKKINNKLTDLKREVEKIEERFEANNIPYDINKVITELADFGKPKTVKTKGEYTVYAMLDRYIDEYSNVNASGSLNVYRSLKKHLQDFEKSKGVTVAFSNINTAFLQSFWTYLTARTRKEKDGKTVKALNNITIAKQLSTLKTFLKYARSHKIDVPLDYIEWRSKVKPVPLEVISLTLSEFHKLQEVDLSANPAYDRVRDVFLFSCQSGLRYSDLKFERSNIEGDYIRMRSKKTGDLIEIPITPGMRNILEKYKLNKNPLPVISNQKSNKYLEEVCKIAGFDEKKQIVRKYGNQIVKKEYHRYELLRFHSGRKSFVSLASEAGMSAHDIKAITGHKDERTFSRYLNIEPERKSKVMNEIWSKINQKLKAV